MAEQLLSELEKAAQVVLAPPNLVAAEQRRSAEAVFLNFRKTKAPYQLCRQILETNTNDYILFEAAGLIKIALVQEWSTLSKEDISSLRQYLSHYVINKPNLAPYVRGIILQVIALMIKRGNVDDEGQERHCMLGELENLIMTGDLQRKILGCNLISAIMQEYVISYKSSNMGLTFEVHLNEREGFQNVELKRIFKFCLGVLDELVKKDMQEDTVTLLKHLLPIVEVVLTWPFVRQTYSCLIPLIESVHHMSRTTQDLRLTKNWQDVMLDPHMLDVFFTLYWKIRGNPQLAHHARTCLVQLASLTGGIMSPEEIHLKYISDYMQRFFKLMSSIEVIDQEASGIATILRKLFNYIQTNLASIPKEEMLKPFMEHLFQLTCQFIKNAAQEESLCTDDCLYTEALDTLFETWICISILSEKYLFLSDFYKQSCAQMFNIYLQCHLFAPEGIRNIEDKELYKEEMDTEIDDKVRFEEQLQTVGTFGKQVPNHALTLLAQLIEDRTAKLRDYFNKLVRQIESLNVVKDNSMIRLYEDIHWLILITGHVLCMESIGELALIPSDIMKYSMQQAQQGKIDLNLTLQYLASSENISSDVNVAPDSVDHTIRLVADVFRLCAIEKTAISVNLSSILSPELSCTIMWFLHRWCLNYFLPVESNYTVISVTFIEAFGEDSPGALWIINFLLEKIEYTINAFKSEPGLMKETMKLLISLANTHKQAKCVLKSERFGSIINLATKGQHDFPQVVKRGLMRAMVQVGVAVQNTSTEQCYWSQTLQPIQDRCKQIISNEKFLQSYHQEEIKVQIIDILESYIGIAQGIQGLKAGSLFQYIHPVLCELPKLLSLYYNYQQIVQLILELLSEYTKRVTHIYLTETDAVLMSEIVLNVIQTYARCNRNRVTVDSTSEEDSYQDILLLMEFLTNLLNVNDVLYPSSTPHLEAFLCGLNIIMPLMTVDLLKFPSLSMAYFGMIRSLSLIYPEEVLNLQSELLQPLLASVELGVFSFGSEVSMQCCNIIQTLATRVYGDILNGRPRSPVMAPFLNSLMTVILSHRVDSAIVTDISTPLYYLIACYKDEYQRFVESILATQTDLRVVQRLADAFTKLTENIQVDTERLRRTRFKTHFDTFVGDVQGLLMIK